MREDTLRALSDVRLDGQSIDQEAGSEESVRSSSIAFVDEEGVVDNVFEVMFREVPSSEGEGTSYLVVTWVVFPPDEVHRGAARNHELLALLNLVNAEPGAKCRIETDGDTEVLLCETDLPVAGLTTDAIELALARSRDVVASYFDALESLVRG
ncbi:MAG: hypothetical protein ACR2MB_11770 [Acidimicrobiales bacterium]